MYFKKHFFLGIFLFFGMHQYVQEERMYSFEIDGNKKVKIGYLQKRLNIEIGAVLNLVVRQQNILFSKSLHALSNAHYEVKKQRKNQYQINIEENFTIISALNFWKTTKNKFAYKIGVYDYNPLKQNILLGVWCMV
jgi:plasmid maintenance system killer protein